MGKSSIEEKFLREYSTVESIKKYKKATAGYGISYLLEHAYGEIYLKTIKEVLGPLGPRSGLRLLEFGCGAGMNLIHLVSLLKRNGFGIEVAWGSDFSPGLIQEAKNEAIQFLSVEDQKKVDFCVSRNEFLIDDLCGSKNCSKSAIENSFHFIIGVNTLRYCHRLQKANECARDIYKLLKPGGICVVIDMNQKFPMFRSGLRDRLTKCSEEYYLPSLEEYAKPFSTNGFQIVRKENFCWIPHSAGPTMCALMSFMAPLLNSVARKYAMRSLVIAKKP
jgi:SAM-dependent methyltransferase